MSKLKIDLITMKDCNDFVKVVSSLKGKIVLENGDGFCVNAKSLLGAMASVEWDNLWVVSEEDIYSAISKWVI